MDHEARVRALVKQILALRASEGTTHIAKDGVRHVVPLPSDGRLTGRAIDTSPLTHILSIDPARRRTELEPGVTFEQLVRATLPLGLAPAVVPELRGITVGGAVAGCSVESASFRYGGFHDTCVAYEVVTGRGEVLEVSDEAEPELFHHLHGSYGTLGTITKVVCSLVPAQPFVELEYRHLASHRAFEDAVGAACSLADAPPSELSVMAPPDFVDGIVHDPDHFVLCLGRYTGPPPKPPSDYTGTGIYYRSTTRLRTDVLDTEQYFFRYDTECHWLTRTLAPLEWWPVRRAVGRWFLGSTNLIAWSDRLAPMLKRVKRRPDLVCDVFIPASRFAEFWDWYLEAFDFFPLWVVPYRPARVYPWIGAAIRDRLTDELFLDLAVYGAPNGAPDRDLSVLLEEKVWELGGIKTLIGRNHYDRDRFWQVYDREAYLNAKKRLDPDGLFPDLYDKLGRVG